MTKGAWVYKVDIIAEAGINHQGDMGIAKAMIGAAAMAGADVWKTQWYDPEKVLGKDSPYFAEAGRAQFSEDQHAELKAFCDMRGIEWCVSIFDPSYIPAVEAIGIRRYKIASRAVTSDGLIDAVARTGKPMVVSTGMCDSLRIRQIVGMVGKGYPLTLLYCVCDYPTKPDRINLERMALLRNHGVSVGFSSHCPQIGPTLAAVARGARVTENHVVLNKLQKGCDVSSSIDFNELSDLVILTREMEKIA